MELTKTKALMEDKRAAKKVDSYAVLVYDHGDETLITSPDVNDHTYFDAASMGKVLVTSTMILRAADAGLLTLEDTLPRFFDNVPADKRHITVLDMLLHRSGIIRKDFDKSVSDGGRKAIADYILSVPLAFETGTKYQYSCSAYILLGFIVEKAFGKPLDEVYYEQVKVPLGLPDMRFHIALDEPNAAMCYRHKEDLSGLDGREDDELAQLMKGVCGNGASFWSMADIRTYLHAVMARSPKLYDPKWYDEAERNLTPALSEGRGIGYLVTNEAYPQTGRLFPVGSFGHCGHTGQSFFVDRTHERFVIILTNATRCANRAGGYKGYDYGDICRMRAEIHNAVADDLGVQ